MNKNHILRVADAIEQRTIENLGFNMAVTFARYDGQYADQSGHDCGTIACIAGWSVAFREQDRYGEVSVSRMAATLEEYGGNVLDDARVWLGLDTDRADALFYGRHHPSGSINSISVSEAVRTLRHLAETGKVDWEACRD